jgi:hypothetical protein
MPLSPENLVNQVSIALKKDVLYNKKTPNHMMQLGVNIYLKT